MKPNSYLINAGRGTLVNETDLAACLNAHGIAGAAVDIMSSRCRSTTPPPPPPQTCS